jgi:Tfp pilus assembly protein PilO
LEAIWIVNILLGVIGAGLSFAVTNLYTQLREIKHDSSELHNIYAKRDDVTSNFEIIRDTLKRIEEKLDRKQDR